MSALSCCGTILQEQAELMVFTTSLPVDAYNSLPLLWDNSEQWLQKYNTFFE